LVVRQEAIGILLEMPVSFCFFGPACIEFREVNARETDMAGYPHGSVDAVPFIEDIHHIAPVESQIATPRDARLNHQ